MTDVASWDEDGVTVIPSDELSPDARTAVCKVSETKRTDGTTTVRVKLHAKTDALTNLAKHLGLLPTNIRHEGSVDVNHNLGPRAANGILALDAWMIANGHTGILDAYLAWADALDAPEPTSLPSLETAIDATLTKAPFDPTNQ